jgi:hypothetical protein
MGKMSDNVQLHKSTKYNLVENKLVTIAGEAQYMLLQIKRHTLKSYSYFECIIKQITIEGIVTLRY